MATRIDHLVIGAADLLQGAAFVRDCLGVEMPAGGAHESMGTHNLLMQLGNEIFLEVIAVNPEGKPPGRPRWYGLDDPYVRKSLVARPALLSWVAGTADIGSALRQARFCFGRAEMISRGKLSWYFGLPEDGRLLAAGMLPYLIQWRSDTHPSRNMADTGCHFEGLEIHHPCASWLRSILDSIGAADLVTVHPLQENEAPYLLARIGTPNGVRHLRSLDAGAI